MLNAAENLQAFSYFFFFQPAIFYRNECVWHLRKQTDKKNYVGEKIKYQKYTQSNVLVDFLCVLTMCKRIQAAFSAT